MSSFQLVPVHDRDFPTLGRKFADGVIDQMLDTPGNTFRLDIFLRSGQRASPAVHSRAADMLKERIDERRVGIDVALDKHLIYLRRSCTRPR